MNKDDILGKLNPAQIYAKFLNLPEIPKTNIKSPFSEDRNPSLKIYRNGTFKCFSSGKQGDVFQFVADLKNLDCRRDFKQVLETVAREFGITGSDTDPAGPGTPDSTPGDARSGAAGTTGDTRSAAPDDTAPDEKHLVVITKDFGQNHFDYWFHLLERHDTVPFLNRYGVKPLKHLEYYSHKTGSVQKYTVYKGVLSFVYELDGRYEIYTPEQPEKKIKKFFYSGLLNSDIFGLGQLPEKVQKLIVCAGKKDCLCLNARNFPAVTFRSEAVFPTAEQIQILKDRAEKLFICYDNDFDKPGNPGRTQMLKIAEKYAVTPIFLPDRINELQTSSRQKKSAI
jgi:hypothetical protein